MSREEARTDAGPDVSIEAVDPHGDDARWCLERYFADIGRLVGETVTLAQHPIPPAEELLPPRGVFLVARVARVARDGGDGEPVGCGALLTLDPGVGYLSRMWVADGARGRGLGRRLLAELERHARALGHARLRLYTHRNLVAAQALYRGAGFREVAPFFTAARFADHFFEKEL